MGLKGLVGTACALGEGGIDASLLVEDRLLSSDSGFSRIESMIVIKDERL